MILDLPLLNSVVQTTFWSYVQILSYLRQWRETSNIGISEISAQMSYNVMFKWDECGSTAPRESDLMCNE